jgi:iron complex outermembrane receptor protein
MRAFALCIISVLASPFVLGQSAAAQAEAEKPAKKVQIEEITVTAERREENVQDIGAAIEAFSTEDLERRGITDIYDLQTSVPSLQVTGGLPQPTLRGVSSDIVSPGVDAPFAAHINGQYVPQLAVALLPFLDIQRVEILYGPQGTLFGHATTGGTMNFITKLPEADLGAEIQADYASNEKAWTQMTLNVPLVPEKVLARLAYRHDWPSRSMDIEHGHNRALSTVALPGGDSARLTLSFLPQDNVRLDLVGGWVFDNSTGGAVKRLDPYPTYPTDPTRSPLTNNFSASPNFTGASPNPRDPDKVSWNLRQSQDYTVGMAQALFSVDMDWATFRSNSSYYSFDYYVDRDQDASDLEIQRLHLESFDVQYGQEFLLQSATGEHFDWLLGANYYNHNTPDADVPIWDKQVSADAANYIIVSTDPLAPPVSVFTPLAPGPILRAHSSSKTRVWGAFANGTYKFTEQFRFTGGIRYSDTRRWFNDKSFFNVYIQVPPSSGGPIPGVAIYLPTTGAGDQNNSWDFITWKAGFEYEPVEKSLLYISYGRGEQAGGYNFLSVAPNIPPGGGPYAQTVIPPFDSEKIYALEGGSKNMFLDDRLQLNLAAFFYNYKDKFIARQVASGITETVNAPRAQVYGAELTSLWLPTDEIELNASLGLTHSEYTKDFFAVNNNLSAVCTINAPCNPATPFVELEPLPEVNLKGNRLNRTPAVTLSVGAQYAFALGDWGTLTPRVDHYWRDKIYFSQFNDTPSEQGSYSMTNARIRLEPADQHYWIEIYGTNLQNNKKIRTQVEGLGANPQWWLEEPRVFGVNVGYNYF